MFDYDMQEIELDAGALFPEELENLRKNNFIDFHKAFLKHRAQDMAKDGCDAETIRCASLIVFELYNKKFS